MQSGQPLDTVLGDPSLRIPPLYRAVIHAGLQAGRLPAALESVARSTRWLAECRRTVIGSLVYPLILFLLGWGFLVFFVLQIAPRLARSMEVFGAMGSGLMATLVRWGESAEYWGPAVPAVVLVFVAVWWFVSARANLVQPYSCASGLGMGSVDGRNPHVVTPGNLHRSVGNPGGERGAVARSLGTGRRNFGRPTDCGGVRAPGRGHSPRRAGCRKTALGRLPPAAFDRWLLAAGEQRGTLLTALRHAADTYRRRAQRQAEIARLYVPVLATVLIGGTLVLVQAVLVFGSWASLLQALVGIALP